MIQLTTDLSDPILELIHEGQAPVDAVEVGPWFDLQQTETYRQELPDLPFYFHGGDLINGIGLISDTVSTIQNYQHSTESPWLSFHLTFEGPGVRRLMMRHSWQFPPPDPEGSARRLVSQVKYLASKVRIPLLLENDDPLPFAGHHAEIQPEMISRVLYESDCSLLLDTGHARLAAVALNLDIHDYLAALPFERVRQIHVSGPRWRDGRLVDAHEPLEDVDYELLDYLLDRTNQQVVTLEYIRERKPLYEQLIRLRSRLLERQAETTRNLRGLQRKAV